ncbi:TPA: hypothetical protein DCE37_25020 [Candidatus Latescibacteria bacterium]|nr:hypothetical protein [Candidatus Latescibacterota bacterium]|tara:strand:- start:54 stop:236 length:183 start_codon:yes stop_codon:yes gene_type:complete
MNIRKYQTPIRRTRELSENPALTAVLRLFRLAFCRQRRILVLDTDGQVNRITEGMEGRDA